MTTPDTRSFVPFARPSITERERRTVLDALHRGTLVMDHDAVAPGPITSRVASLPPRASR